MKKIVFTAAIALGIAGMAMAQKSETIEGNGKQVTRDVSVKSFNAIKASGVYELRLSQGSTESVKIEADENLQELFNVHNEGSKLIIEMKDMKNKNLKSKNKMRVYVTFKNLADLELSTVGNVKSDKELSFNDLNIKSSSVGNIDLKLTADKITIKNTSVGNVHLEGKAQSAVFKNSGVGNLNAGDFVVQSVDIDNSGVGHAEVNATKDLKVSDTMLGKVKNKGTATAKKTKVTI